MFWGKNVNKNIDNSKLLVIALIVLVVITFYNINSRLSGVDNKKNNSFSVQVLDLAKTVNGISINKNVVLITEEGDKVTIGDIINGENKIMLKYNKLNCSVCNDEEIKNIKKEFSKTNTEKIILISKYDELKELVIFKRVNNLHIPVYNLPEGMFLSPIDKKNYTYYFTTDSSLIIKDCFIPIQNYPELSKYYLQSQLLKS
ncbi:MAG: hypothetical protein KKB34_13505 [Bacteroidetes bacterium]|nr:hypothetical protein [Bacteroidota bacterium]